MLLVLAVHMHHLSGCLSQPVTWLSNLALQFYPSMTPAGLKATLHVIAWLVVMHFAAANQTL